MEGGSYETFSTEVPKYYHCYSHCPAGGGLVRRTLDQLPERFVTLVHLVYFQGMRYKEAAEVLDIPVGTVKSRLNAAINRLTEFWKTSQVD